MMICTVCQTPKTDTLDGICDDCFDAAMKRLDVEAWANDILDGEAVLEDAPVHVRADIANLIASQVEHSAAVC